MKIKSLLLIASLFCSVFAFAQKGELNRGKASYSKFNEVKLLGNPTLGMSDLEAAKASLEKASAHDKTSGLSETWAYLALVYADYVTLDSTGGADEYKQKTVAAIEKAKTLEGAEEQEQNIDVATKTLAQAELNVGVKAFENQDFEGAYNAFNKGLEYMPNDSMFTYYAGLAAINSQDYSSAIEKYTSLLEHEDFSNLSQIYMDLSRIYMMQSDTASAIKYAKEGSAKFPENQELATQNIELNLQAGNDAEVIADIASQIEKDPSNAVLHYYHGIALGASEKNDEAEAAYKKSLELDSESGVTYINLGALLLNKGISTIREASNLPANQQQKYNEQLQIANKQLDEAFPFLEKATQLNPESAHAWQNLKVYYQLKEDEAKVSEIDQKINSL